MQAATDEQLDAWAARILTAESLEQLSSDPEVRRRVREREDSVKLYEMSLAASKVEGKVEVLLELLELRFGALSESNRARVQEASTEQLDAWVARILTAETLDDVLEP